MTLNVGGMDTVTFDTFMQWLPEAPFDVIALQEIHHGLGKSSSQWSTAGWHFVTSVDPKKRFQGLAILVRHALVGEDELQFREYTPGRILHVRISRHDYHIDLLNFYQHALQSDATGANLSARQQQWDRLGELLQTLARRNMLLLFGDFNCTPIHASGHTGQALPRSELYPDAADFTTLLEANQLVLLNTWGRRRDLHTFQGSRRKSYIDFVATRRVHADQIARQAAPDKDITFSPWRQGGRHFAVRASVAIHPGWQQPSRRHPPQPRIQYDGRALDDAVRRRTPEYHALRLRFQQAAMLSTAPTLEDMNRIMLGVVCSLFPKQTASTALRAWQMDAVKISVADMWRARRKLKQGPRLSGFKACFRAWVRHRDFQQAYKELRRQGRQARKAVLERYLQQAQEAVSKGDTGLLHRVIRAMAPKTQYSPVRIQGINGQLLTYAQEHQEIVKHFQQLFQSHRPGGCSASLTNEATYHVSPTDFRDALRSLKIGKAVPSGCAPTSAIRACADLIAEVASPIATDCLRGHDTPALWADCTLALIPKPHKVSKRPENLRPLGLQDSGAKAYAKLLKTFLLQEVGGTLQSLPLFAYLPGRSTESAIARVIQHCSEVRDLHSGQVATVHTRRAHKRTSNICGGIQLAIDLSTAFDLVPREQLRNALVWAGASGSLTATILNLHDVCRYSIQHRGRIQHINMRRGVRQGCTLAPLLWVIYSAYIASHLKDELSGEWVDRHLTLYADDTHASWVVHTQTDLEQAFQSIRLIFSMYERFGMQVNPSKSGVVLGIRGLLGRSLLAGHVQGPKDNRRLVLGPPHDQLVIPVKTSMTYLGVQISYGNYEDETLAARLKVAQGTRCRILKVLHGRRYLTQTKRLQLYFLCVRTAAHYGLLPVGITASGLAKLSRFETKHIRAIVRSPVHITREATASLYQRLALLQPAEYLLKLLTKKLRKLTISGDAWSWTWVNNRKDQIQQHVHASQHGLQEASHAQPYSCPTCGLYFDTLAGMRTHHTRKHGVKLQRTTAGPAHMLHGLRIQDHCVDNMPVCRHCCCTFSTWHTFRVHVTKSCSVLHGQTQSGPALPSAAGATPKLAMQSAAELIISPKSGNLNVQAPFEMPEVQRLLSSADWKNILQLGRMREILVHHCMLCSQWVASSPGALLRHVRQLHPELVMHIDNAMAHSITLREGHARPCKACGAAPRGKHRCRVLFQLCLMLHYHRMLRLFGLPDGGHDPAGADLRCPEASPGHLLGDGRGCREDGGGPDHPGQAGACFSHQGLPEGTATGGQGERTRSGDGDGPNRSLQRILPPSPPTRTLEPGPGIRGSRDTTSSGSSGRRTASGTKIRR